MRAVCTQVLCKILEKNQTQASRLLTAECIEINDPMFKVYSIFNNLIATGEVQVLRDDEEESSQYLVIIFDLLKILLITHEFDLFEKALGLLNSVTDKTVLLKLAKLYYSEKCYGLAYQEFIRSIKLFDLIDAEGATMLQKLKYMGF